MDRDTLPGLSKDDLIVLVLAQAAQIAAPTRRVADLEARLGQPPKTPDNSSLPPSRGAKPDLPAPGDKPRRKGHPGSFRALHPEPDRVSRRWPAPAPTVPRRSRRLISPACMPTTTSTCHRSARS